jgi:serine/threonine-protein phosphatase 4 regulatory subunit 1
MSLNMQTIFVSEVDRVGHDLVYWVRREASFAVGALAKVVPLELVLGSLVGGQNTISSHCIDTF